MTPPQRLVLTVAILGSFVAFLDSTIVNVALPAIARDLGGGLSTQQWTVDAYLVTLGALILVAGAVSDAFGRILVLRIGLIGFGIASLAVTATGHVGTANVIGTPQYLAPELGDERRALVHLRHDVAYVERALPPGSGPASAFPALTPLRPIAAAPATAATAARRRV